MKVISYIYELNSKHIIAVLTGSSEHDVTEFYVKNYGLSYGMSYHLDGLINTGFCLILDTALTTKFAPNPVMSTQK